MSTLDTVLLIVVSSLLSALILVGIGIGFAVLKLVSDVRQVVSRAEDMIESVESATEILRHTEGRMAMFKLVRNIVKLVERGRK